MPAIYQKTPMFFDNAGDQTADIAAPTQFSLSLTIHLCSHARHGGPEKGAGLIRPEQVTFLNFICVRFLIR